MGEDVKVTIGGDLSPIQRTFAEVKRQAGEAGEAAGLEFGNRTAFMAEARVKRGMDGVLKSLATAKDPIEGIAGAIEGLGNSFRISGAAFLGLGIGTFLKEQLEKAAEGASDFYEKTNDIFALANNSTKEFTDKAIKNFESAKEAYGKEGFFEYLIYGSGQKATLAAGEAAYEQALERARAFREASYKAEADSLSQNQAERADGEIQKVNERYDAEIAKAQEAGDSVVEIERAKAEAISKIQLDAAKKTEEGIRALRLAQSQDPGLSEADKVANKKKFAQEDVDTTDAKAAKSNAAKLGAEQAVEEAQKEADFRARVKAQYDSDPNKVGGAGKIVNDAADKAAADLKQKQLELTAAQEQSTADLTEHQKAMNALKEIELQSTQKILEAQKKEADGLARSKKEAADLKTELSEAGLTEQQKVDALKDKIANAQKDAARNAPLQTAEQKQDAQNQITKDQIKLKDAQKSADDKKAEETKRRDALAKEQTGAKAELATAQANAMGAGHTVVSSLRREGFGKTPGVNKDSSQLKAVQASEKHLSTISTEIAALNAKIGGAA